MTAHKQEQVSLLHGEQVVLHDEPRWSRKSLAYALAGLLCTLLNCYIFWLSNQSQTHTRSVRTYEEMIRLRRPNQFIGLEQTSSQDWNPSPKRIHFNLLSVVNKSDPDRAYGDDFARFKAFPEAYPPTDRIFMVSSEVSTIVEFVTTDFRMENCQLEVSLPPKLESNSSLTLVNSDNLVEMWLLDSPRPLYAKTVTWNHRPVRKMKIAEIAVKLGMTYTYNFTCPLNSVWAFEFSPAEEETNVEWRQDWRGPSPRVTLFQRGSKTAMADPTTPNGSKYLELSSNASDSRWTIDPQDPTTPLTWSFPQPDQVIMRSIHASEHYTLNSSAWAHQLPSSGHLIHLDEADSDSDSTSTHTVALFHQLKCLEILRDVFQDNGSHLTTRKAIASHCMNYVRESLLCMADMRNSPQGTLHTIAGYDMLCYDWEVLFEEAERNKMIFEERILRR